MLMLIDPGLQIKWGVNHANYVSKILPPDQNDIEQVLKVMF